ncbi:tetratricopeptide repeat protein [Planktomarina temperata]|nr:tetratricopeptide repeat protein [Planktomarina temperata]
MGITLQEQGKLEAAIKALNKALAIKPDHARAYNNMGNILKEQGKLEEAIEAYNDALIIKPDYADAYNNMGVTLHEQGKLEAAIKAYNRALAATRPNYADAYTNMGGTLHRQGKLEEAIETYNKALAIKPDYAEAYNNMGFSLKEQGKLEEAIEAYNKALTIKPDYAEARNNMGNVLKEQGKLEEAIEAYKKALAIKPDYADAHNNMGVTLHEKGKLKEAIEAYKKSLAIQPNYISAWNNIAFSLQSIKLKVPLTEELTSYYPEDTGCNHYETYRTTLNYILNFGTTHAESAFNEALKASGNFENLTIKNPNFNSKSNGSKMPLPEKVVALVHWGRSGTGLLHSLIDNHPEVSTLPSSYLSEYFNYSNWEKIISDGWSQMAARFIAIYDVIFDAKSKVPIQTKSQQLLYNFGLKEGMANVGDQRDEVLKVDKDVFHAELLHLMNFYDHLDALLFFKLVHLAYDKAIGDVDRKSLIFYHIHNPDTNAQVNFVKSVPEANWIMMVREPLQSCESWVRQPFEQNNYIKVVGHIRTMLFEIDTVIYHKQNSAGVRLEDLKERPRQTIPVLCNWMGIEETESLYEMTAQGKKWWGDPSSPDYAQDGMNPFGKTSINRKIGSIFSERDQYILQTLFYPFSVRFGYVEENEEQFQIDLQAIRPMLDKMFDFEKVLAEKTHVEQEHFMKTGSYLYLRSGLIERWATLNEFGTYPNMIEPLQN